MYEVNGDGDDGLAEAAVAQTRVDWLGWGISKIVRPLDGGASPTRSLSGSQSGPTVGGRAVGSLWFARSHDLSILSSNEGQEGLQKSPMF
jgi:hypothetical protein